MLYFISRLLHSIKPFVLPSTTITYFDDYFNYISCTIQQRDTQKRLFIKLLNTIQIIQTFRYLYLSFPTISELNRVLHFDGTYLALIPRSTINALAIITQLVVVYYNDILYFKADYVLFELLHKMLIKSQWKGFLSSS